MDNNILDRRADRGWEKVPDSAPLWVRKHISEIRSATLENREVSAAYMKTYARESEVRSLAVRQANVIPVTLIDAENRTRLVAITARIKADELRAAKRAEDDDWECPSCGEDDEDKLIMLDDDENVRCLSCGRRFTPADERAAKVKAEQETASRDFRRRNFPWESC